MRTKEFSFESKKIKRGKLFLFLKSWDILSMLYFTNFVCLKETVWLKNPENAANNDGCKNVVT
jgi:hypothetical protein